MKSSKLFTSSYIFTPSQFFGTTRSVLVKPAQPYLIPHHHRPAFPDAWREFQEWSASSGGERQIQQCDEIRAEEASLKKSADWFGMKSSELIRGLIRFRCLDRPILNILKTPMDTQRNFAAYAFLQAGQRGERGWRRYASHLALLPALRAEYCRRLDRTPIGQAILEIFYGDPRKAGESWERMIEILRRSAWPREASAHSDPEIRKEDTRSVLTVFLCEQLSALRDRWWTDLVPDLLDRRVASPTKAISRITDEYRKSCREESRLTRMTVPEPPGKIDPLPPHRGEEPEFADRCTIRDAIDLNRDEIVRRFKEDGLGMIEAFLDPEVKGRLSQKSLADRVGKSPRTVCGRLHAMRDNEWFRRLLIENS